MRLPNEHTPESKTAEDESQPSAEPKFAIRAQPVLGDESTTIGAFAMAS